MKHNMQNVKFAATETETGRFYVHPADNEEDGAFVKARTALAAIGKIRKLYREQAMLAANGLI